MLDKNKQDDATVLNADLKYLEHRYRTYYNQVLVKEQPFYHYGMTDEEAAREMEYLNNNLKAFYEGKYMPLWKQNWIK